MINLNKKYLLIIFFIFLQIPSVSGLSYKFYVKPDDLLVYTYDYINSYEDSTHSIKETWKYEITTVDENLVQFNTRVCPILSFQTVSNCVLENENDSYETSANYSSAIGNFILPITSNGLNLIPFTLEINGSMFNICNLESGVIIVNQTDLNVIGTTILNETLSVIYEYDNNGILQKYEMSINNNGNQTYIGLILDTDNSFVKGILYTAFTIENWVILLLYTGVLIALIGAFWQNRKKFHRIPIFISIIIVIIVYIFLVANMVVYRINALSEPKYFIPLLIILVYYLIKSGENPKYKEYQTARKNYTYSENKTSKYDTQNKQKTKLSTNYPKIENNMEQEINAEPETAQIQFDMKKEMQRFEDMRFNQDQQSRRLKSKTPQENDILRQEIIVPDQEILLEKITYLPLDAENPTENDKISQLSPEEQEMLRLGIEFVSLLKSTNLSNSKQKPIFEPKFRPDQIREIIQSEIDMNKSNISASEPLLVHRILAVKILPSPFESIKLQISVNEKPQFENFPKTLNSIWEWTSGEKMQKFVSLFTNGSDYIVNLNENHTQIDFDLLEEKLKENLTTIDSKFNEIFKEIFQKISESATIIKGTQIIELIAYILDLPKDELVGNLMSFIKIHPILWLQQLDIIILKPVKIIESLYSFISNHITIQNDKEFLISINQWQEFLKITEISEEENVYLFQILGGYHIIEFVNINGPKIRFHL